MNLAALRSEVLSHGFDPVQFGISRINQYLNDAQNLIARRVDWYVDEGAYTFATVVGTTMYPLPSDFARERSAFNTDRNIELRAVSLRDIDRSSPTSSQPLFYAFDGANLHLFPTPDNVYNLEMRYWKLPTALVNDTDTPTIPDTWQRLLWYWANKECYAAEDDPESAQYWEQQFNTTLAEFAADVKFPNTDYPTRMEGMWESDRNLTPAGWTLWGGNW